MSSKGPDPPEVSRWYKLGESVTAGAAHYPDVKSPEVMLISFVSASSSRLTLADLLSSLPCGLQRAISLGLRAHRQPDKPVQRLGTLSCLQRSFLFSSTSALL